MAMFRWANGLWDDMDDKPLATKTYGASELGWVRVRPDVWQKPNGDLHKHHNTGEPMIDVVEDQ